MKHDFTELVFILDKSGSMAGLEKETIAGFNDMLAKQRGVAGDCNLTTVLFDHTYRLLHERRDTSSVKPISEEEYAVGGNTALHDAIGRTIHKFDDVMRIACAERREGKVLFVIITDGLENSSRDFSAVDIRQAIEHRTSQHGWEFIFLGANMDAVTTAVDLGIARNRAQSFHADKAGVSMNFRALGETTVDFRHKASVKEDWNSTIDEDYKERGKKQ